MPHIAVELRKPDGRRIMRRTNINGFANFKMSVLKRDRDVTDPGRYSFDVVPPPGWSVTTGNQRQESVYEILPGAPADMIALAPTHPVGLVADLTISGIAPVGSSVTVTGPDGAATAAALDAIGRFVVPAAPGEWLVDVSFDGSTLQKKVSVQNAPVFLSAISGKAEPDPAPQPTQSVGFDDLIATSSVLEVPSAYGGLGWYNLVAMHQVFTQGPGYINAATSGEFIAYNSSGHPAKVFSDKPFDFVGANFGIGWSDAEGETLILTAWRGEEPAYEDRIELSANGPIHFAADYRGITRLVIRTEHYWQAAIDDFAYRLLP
jgi:hypothetical protein